MIKFTKTSSKLELEGAEGLFPDGAGNFLKLKIARSTHNPHYESKLVKLMEPYRKQMADPDNPVSNDIAKKIMNQVYSEEILLGWDEKVLLDQEGKPFPYSTANALDLLNSDGDLNDFVVKFSSDLKNYIDVKKVSGK